jgi:hypothetical protein
VRPGGYRDGRGEAELELLLQRVDNAVDGTGAALTARDLIDPRIDVGAQRALLRMSKGDPAARAAASGMLAAVRGEQLAGIYGDDLLAAVKLAQRLGTVRWKLVPPGEDAVLVVDPQEPLTLPPRIVFRGDTPDIRSTPSRIDPALRKAWSTFELLRGGQLARCPVPRSGQVATLRRASNGSSPITPLSNLVPAMLCATPSSTRLRLSVWADPQFVTASNIGGGRGIVDDITLLRTVSNDGARAATASSSSPLELTFDRMFLQGGSDDQRSQAYQRMVALCHSLGIQVLAGYGVVTERQIGDRFNAWLRDPGRSPTFEQYARRIARFLLSLSLNPSAPALEARKRFDGLGLDIETLQGDLGDSFTRFCRILAAELARHDMLLAVAAGGMVSEEHAFRAPADPLTGRRPPPLRALPSARAAQYKMALGMPNILIRPMAYDIDLSGEALHRWHQDIVRWALDGVGLPPGQFQLGVKTVHGGLNIGITEAPGEVVDRCVRLLRPNQVGLITFALNKTERWERWDAYDRALNAGQKAPGTLGTPLQGPLTVKSLARLTPALPPGARRQPLRQAQAV